MASTSFSYSVENQHLKTNKNTMRVGEKMLCYFERVHFLFVVSFCLLPHPCRCPWQDQFDHFVIFYYPFLFSVSLPLFPEFIPEDFASLSLFLGKVPVDVYPVCCRASSVVCQPAVFQNFDFRLGVGSFNFYHLIPPFPILPQQSPHSISPLSVLSVRESL